jgi:hypothetical protein
MAYPTAYSSTVAIPLPSEQTVQQIMGKSVRNNASRRVIDPVTSVLKMRPLALPRGYAKTSIKQAQISPPAYRMLTPWSTTYQAIAMPSRPSKRLGQH